MKQSTKTGLLILAVGVFIGLAPMIGVSFGDRTAGWAMIVTIPVGVIVGLLGLFSIAFGKDTSPDNENVRQSSEKTDDDKPAEPVESSTPTLPPTPGTLSPRFGIQQILLMGGTFLLLLTSEIIRLSTQGEYWQAVAGLPFELPKTLGVVVSGVLFVTSLRLRINKTKTWSAKAYQTLFRAQRAFTIPPYASILLLLMLNPASWFDPTDVGSAEGITYNQIMGVTELAPTVIAIVSNAACFWLRSKYNREVEAAQT